MIFILDGNRNKLFSVSEYQIPFTLAKLLSKFLDEEEILTASDQELLDVLAEHNFFIFAGPDQETDISKLFES